MHDGYFFRLAPGPHDEVCSKAFPLNKNRNDPILKITADLELLHRQLVCPGKKVPVPGDRLARTDTRELKVGVQTLLKPAGAGVELPKRFQDHSVRRTALPNRLEKLDLDSLTSIRRTF
jgi:hypothetical protein